MLFPKLSHPKPYRSFHGQTFTHPWGSPNPRNGKIPHARGRTRIYPDAIQDLRKIKAAWFLVPSRALVHPNSLGINGVFHRNLSVVKPPTVLGSWRRSDQEFYTRLARLPFPLLGAHPPTLARPNGLPHTHCSMIENKATNRTPNSLPPAAQPGPLRPTWPGCRTPARGPTCRARCARIRAP